MRFKFWKGNLHVQISCYIFPTNVYSVMKVGIIEPWLLFYNKNVIFKKFTENPFPTFSCGI